MLTATININNLNDLSYLGSLVDNNLSVSVSGTTYTFTDSAENITVGTNPNSLVVTGDGTNTVTVTGINSLAIATAVGADTVSIQSTNVNTGVDGGDGNDSFFVTGSGIGSGIALNINGGTAFNTLNVASSTASPAITPTGGTTNDGTISNIGSTTPLGYANIGEINVTKPVSTVTGSSLVISATEAQSFSGRVVASFIVPAADLGADAEDFAATIAWGDTTVSPGWVVANADGGYNVLGSHSYAAQGTYTATVTVSSLGSSGSRTLAGSNTTLNVTSTPSATFPLTLVEDNVTVAAAPLTAQAVQIGGVEGSALSAGPNGVVVATFADSGTIGVGTDYTATIDWGDGTTATPSTQILAVGTPNGTIFSVYGNHTYATLGVYPVTVSIAKTASGAQATAISTATIADALLTAGPNVLGSTFTGLQFNDFEVGTFTDANPGATADDFTGTIDWGDGSPRSTAIITPDDGFFSVTGSHIYARPGVYTVTTVVFDDSGQSSTLTATMTVIDPAVTGTARNFTAVEGQNTGQFVLATFVSPNTLATVADFRATLAVGGWGDGTPGAAGVTLVVQQIGVTPLTDATNPGAPIFQIVGSHTYTADSPPGTPYALSVVVTTLDGTATTISSAPGSGVTVLEAPLSSSNGTTITGIEGSPTFGPPAGTLLGTFSDLNQGATVADFLTGGGSVVVNWGDGSAPQTLTAANLTAVGSADGIIFRVNAFHTYADAGTYAYNVTVTDAGGATTILSGAAVIADAPLTAPVQPTINTVEAALFPVPVFAPMVFRGRVAAFNDANLGSTAAEFTATIDWGDGTPVTPGTVVSSGTPGLYYVNGAHTYANSGVNGGTGVFNIQVFVQDEDGSRLTVVNTANVADRAIPLTGVLNPDSDSGISHTDAITNVTQPNFRGASEPLSHVSLFANGTFIGQTWAGTDGSWSITSNYLNDGSYRITATAVDQFGVTTTATPSVIVPNLVIDTVGPKVTGLFFARVNGQVQVTYQDFGGVANGGAGVNLSTIADASNYRLTKAQQRHRYLVNVVSVSPGTTSGPQLATLSINAGKYLRGGHYVFTIYAASALKTSGVQDIAGNAFDGEYYKYLPSGNNVRGGDFVATLNAKHRIIYAPGTVIGTASPVTPPGNKPDRVIIRRLNVAATPHARLAARLAARHSARQLSRGQLDR